MTQEEKARAYDEAKARISKAYNDNRCTIGFMNEIFPELAEPEDERIRKAIIYIINYTDYKVIEETDFLATDMTNWLEKQGERQHQREVDDAYLEGMCAAKHEFEKYKMISKWLYRLEYKDASCGLWYDGNGKWCFESGIGSIDGCKTKDLPMEYDRRYKQDGRDWFSSCSKKEDLLHWYSLEDAKKLISNGFVFTRYLATEYHEYEQQTVFIKDTALYREEIDIFELFKQKPEWSEEDETVLDNLIYALKNDKIGNDRDEYVSWLKSLRPHSQWKPSDEQIEILDMVLSNESMDDNVARILRDIKEQLKKLRKE